MIFFQKLKGKNAQHAMEYIVLMILVMAGIIIAGPYVVRSWNANLKGWEDSALDSLQDPFVNASSDSIPEFGACNPTVWADVGCGLGTFNPCTGGTFSCALTEMFRERPYEPANCQCHFPSPPPFPVDNYFECVTDNANNCCTAWTPDPANPGVPNPTEADCGVNAVPPCPDGQYRANRVCDDGDPVANASDPMTKCEASPICDFMCRTPPAPGGPPDYGSLCAGDNLNLPGNVSYSFVPDGACTSTKCEVQCGIDRYVFGSGPGAYCGPCNIWGGMPDGCPPGQVHNEGCPAGQVVACCLGYTPPPPPPIVPLYCDPGYLSGDMGVEFGRLDFDFFTSRSFTIPGTNDVPVLNIRFQIRVLCIGGGFPPPTLRANYRFEIDGHTIETGMHNNNFIWTGSLTGPFTPGNKTVNIYVYKQGNSCSMFRFGWRPFFQICDDLACVPCS